MAKSSNQSMQDKYAVNNPFVSWSINQHDKECNQKYGKHDLPYSFHLHAVYSQARLFSHCIGSYSWDSVMESCYGHDLIEDARVTYGDILRQSSSQIVADAIYACTEEKGKNRDERHNDKFFSELRENKLASFVKLCDIIANVKMSLLDNSSMYEKYKKEFPRVKSFLNMPEFAPMFEYLDKLLSIYPSSANSIRNFQPL